MIRNLLFGFIMLFAVNVAVGQIEVSPSAIILVADGEEQLFVEFDVTNNFGTDAQVWWKFEEGEDFPDDWTPQVCDMNLCYNWGQLDCSSNAPNSIASGETVKFHVKARKDDLGPMNGTSFGIIKFYEDAGFVTQIGSSSSPITSTATVNLDDLVIYPNPTTQSFQIKNDVDIASVSIFNIVGREVSTLTHSEGVVHDVSDLRSGMYLVRLMNDDGEVVKAMRLSKR